MSEDKFMKAVMNSHGCISQSGWKINLNESWVRELFNKCETLEAKLAQQAERIEMLEKIREAAIWTLEEYQRGERKGYEAKISEDLAELLTKTLEAYAAKYEAYEEGRNDAIAEFKSVREQAWSEAVEMGRKEGRREGLEEAAKIAESHPWRPCTLVCWCKKIAENIRAKAAEKGE